MQFNSNKYGTQSQFAIYYVTLSRTPFPLAAFWMPAFSMLISIFFQIQTFLICYFSPGLTFVSLASLFTTCVQMEHSAKFNHVPNDIALDAKLTGNFACNGNLIFPHQRTRINLQLTGKILNTCNYTLLKSNSEKI